MLLMEADLGTLLLRLYYSYPPHSPKYPIHLHNLPPHLHAELADGGGFRFPIHFLSMHTLPYHGIKVVQIAPVDAPDGMAWGRTTLIS
jgi:hypothetical protein